MELVTGYKGYEHVTAEQLAELQAGIAGSSACILNIGEKMRAEAVNANNIRIFDGTALIYGRQCTIDAGQHEDLTIDNGTPGYKRNDLVVFHYIKDVSTGVEDMRLKVVKGGTGETAVDPEVNNRNIRDGATESEIPFLRICLNGLTIEKCERLFPVITTNEDAEQRIQEMEQSDRLLYHAVCSNTAAVTTKAITVKGLLLRTGVKIAVKFTNGISVANTLLNVNNTGAKAIYYKGAALKAGYITTGAYVILQYDGVRWNILGDLADKQIETLNNIIDKQNETIKNMSSTVTQLSKAVEGKQDSLIRGSAMYPDVKNLNAVTTPGYYWMKCTDIMYAPQKEGYGWLEVVATTGTGRMQRYTEYNTGKVYVRTYINLTWYEWKRELDSVQTDVTNLKKTVSGKQDNLIFGSVEASDLNNVKTAGFYWVKCEEIAHTPKGSGFGFLEVVAITGASRLQRYTEYNTGELYSRSFVSSQWSAWKREVGTMKDDIAALKKDKQNLLMKGTVDVNSANSLTEAGFYWVNSKDVSNTPKTEGFGFIEVITPSSTTRLQRYTEYDTAETYTRSYVNATWNAWKKV